MSLVKENKMHELTRKNVEKALSLLRELGVNLEKPLPSAMVGDRKFYLEEKKIEKYSPVDESLVCSFQCANNKVVDNVIEESKKAFYEWQDIPAPKRGEVVLSIAEEFNRYKKELAIILTWEVGKPIVESIGEIQELIDIGRFATGLSRQLCGITTHSERHNHRLYEQWHPLGVVGIITAFNFPVAVWSWNSLIALVCGNTCVWKPSEKAPLTSLITHLLSIRAIKNMGYNPAILSYVFGTYDTGIFLTSNDKIALISATGSVRMGKSVAETVSKRLGKYLLELGGNNAIIISDKGDLSLALRVTLFGAIATAGQRCTSIRRAIISEKIYEKFRDELLKSYHQIRIGNPFREDIHAGPLIDEKATEVFLNAIENAKMQGARLLYGGHKLSGPEYPSDYYVFPAIMECDKPLPITCEETFGPLLYLFKYKTIQEAISLNNEVPQGLSSSIITNDIREAELFLSHKGSDCGIANVNTSTSGAEIGLAFGGEKYTGGGREAGSDAWKNYMRRQSVTINWSGELPLAQGIVFPET